MDTHIRFITTPTADSPGTTLVVLTPRKNYIFGQQSEGTQRALTEMGQRLTKVEDFFITGKMDWQNMGGTIGMLLTLADATASSFENSMEVYQRKLESNSGKAPPEPTRTTLNMYGPPNLKHMLGTCRRYIFRKGMPIRATEFPSAAPAKGEGGAFPPTWKDEQLQIWALSVAHEKTPLDAEREAALASQRRDFESNHNNFEDHQAPENESPEDRELRYDRIRTTVLKHMFDSNWSFDTLVERHISEVEMPTVMYIRDPNTNQLDKYRGPLPGGKAPLPDIKVLTRTPWPGALVRSLPPTRPLDDAVSYIVRTYPARGIFDPKRAQELDVKKGPDWGTLTKGGSVTNSKGETITPDMVMGPDRPGQGVAILDVPSSSHLESLIRREEFGSAKVMEGIQACFWILGSGVSAHPALKAFMDKFGHLKHVIASSDTSPNRLTFDSVAAQTIRLGQIDGDRYRLPYHDNTALPQPSVFGNASQEGGLPPNAIMAERGLHFRLMPRFEMDSTFTPALLDVSNVQDATPPEIIELAEAAHGDIEKDQEALKAWEQLLSRPDTEVMTLGTGSALPSKFRNVSATLVRVPGIGNYLFDCGENTLGQLQRAFNPKDLDEVIRNLRMIWISHLHADHHLGTASVIKAWYRIVHNSVPLPTPHSLYSITTKPSDYGLSVISHEGMQGWLKEYSSVEDFGYSRIVPLVMDPVGPRASSGSTLSIYMNKQLPSLRYESILGVSDIQACAVSHCHGAMAVSLTFPQDSSSSSSTPPLKVSYSGDCRPSATFPLIGRDTTVLIHEATFDDELQGDAIAKKHSTTSEALGIGAQMGAKAVVLTHFSQRYQKIPVLQTVEGADGHEEKADVDDVPMEDAAIEEEPAEIEDAPQANPDIRPSTTTAPRSTAALPSDSAHPPKLHHQQSSDHEKVIKVRNKDMKVAIAFDYMRVRIGDIAKLEKFNPALTKLLVADEQEEEEKGKEGGGDEDGEVNKNGKKTSPEKQGGGKKKKSRRNN
jgi:ribonuclease Z